MSIGRFGLLGEHLSHSASKALHEYLGNYSYELIEKDEEGVKSLFIKPEYDGFNVTIPYKVLACSLCDELSVEASAIGSVNTVVFDSCGHSMGYNTDAFGFEYLLDRNEIAVENKNCLVLGTGGASRAVIYALGLHNAKSITVCSRNVENKSELFDDISGRIVNIISYEDIIKSFELNGAIKEYDIIINTTPVGMYSGDDDSYLDMSPVDLTMFDGLDVLVDIIYNPIQTKLCAQAQELGIKWVSGLQMLIAQGYKASMIFKETVEMKRK